MTKNDCIEIGVDMAKIGGDETYIIENANGVIKHNGKVIAEHDQGVVIDCQVCRYAHLFPLSTRTEAYYREDRFYQHHSPADWLSKEVEEYNSGLWDSAYHRQAKLLFANFPLLDVGCSTGTFLHFWRKNYGKNTVSWGIEPSKMARKKSVVMSSKIVPDYETFINSARSGWANFNVRLSLVLEHIPNPVEFLRQYVNILGNGNMMIIVPNEFNPLQRRVGGNWFVSDVHTNYFTSDSLLEVMQEAGLQVVYQTATFPTELFILMGLDHRGNDKLGRKLHRYRLLFEKKVPGIFKAYHTLYHRFQWGRELIFVGVKSCFRPDCE